MEIMEHLCQIGDLLHSCLATRERKRKMRRGGFGGGGGGGRPEYRNPCLTMHQPWASLLVHGIKRIEGRSWPSPITGRLWIHAAGKVPDPETIKAMEDFYREIYAVNGVSDIKFPEHYPVSRLVGCVDVVGCLRCEELVSWEDLPESVRLEGLTDFCWLCENPQKLVVPFEMRGFQGVYNLEKRVYEAAFRGLRRVESPLPVKFTLPDPSDRFSLRPGSLTRRLGGISETPKKSEAVSAAIAGAQAAANQYSRKGPGGSTGIGGPNRNDNRGVPGSNGYSASQGGEERYNLRNGGGGRGGGSAQYPDSNRARYDPSEGGLLGRGGDQPHSETGGSKRGPKLQIQRTLAPHSEAPPHKLFTEALKGMR